MNRYMDFWDRLLGPRVGPKEYGWFNRHYRIRFLTHLLTRPESR